MLIQKRIAVVVLVLAAASLLLMTQTDSSGWTWTNGSVPRNPLKGYQLGGAWEGELNGITWMGIHAPLDPNGTRAAVKWQWMTGNSDVATRLESVGATSLSECVGDIVMRSNDTAEYVTVTYAIGPNAEGLPELKLKLVTAGTWRFRDLNTAESADVVRFYLPDGSATDIPPVTYPPHLHHRVTVD